MVNIRKESLITGEIYHTFNKSIAGFKIFNNISDMSRIMKTIRYYQREKPQVKFSKFIKLSKTKGRFPKPNFRSDSNRKKLIEIIAYCIMPTHLHFILKQIEDKGVSIFMSNIQNSYARYFNTKIDRKGPLWVGNFKNVLVRTDEQLIHLTRYIHLNPVTSFLVNKPEEWSTSSYHEYIAKQNSGDKLCDYDNILDIDSFSYKDFVEDSITYQRDLAKIKDLIIE